MTIKQALDWAIKNLKTKKTNSPILDAEVLLSFVLKKDRTFLFARSEKNLTQNQEKKFKKLIVRRASREPIAYITNKKEFYGLEFYVDKNILIPRPETELMVEEVVKIIKTYGKKINLIDVGTGSGCLLISILKQIPQIKLDSTIGLDFSKKALIVAKKNARKHKILNRTQFVYSNLLDNIKSKNNASYVITANLPYLTSEQYKKLSPDIKKYEPKSAFVAGKDGLRYYHKLLKQIAKNTELLFSSLQILLEINPTQSESIKKLIEKYLPKAKIKIKKDLAGLDRLVIIKSNK